MTSISPDDHPTKLQKDSQVDPPPLPPAKHQANDLRDLPPRRNIRRTAASQNRNNCEEEIHSRPPIAMQTSSLWNDGRGSHRHIQATGSRQRSLRHQTLPNPWLFKQAYEFVYVYATMKDLIPMEESQESDSPYIWTNSKNLQLDWDPEAL